MTCRWGVAAVVAIAFAARAEALDTFGPPIGANKYSASIRTVGGIADEDDYVASLLAGEKLSVTVAAAKGSALLPSLSLVDPDGVESAPAVVVRAGGKSVSLSGFSAPRTGRWGVRVSGANGTEGAYTIAFSVKPARAAPATKVHLGGADPLTTDVVFDGIDGALLDVTVKWPKKQSAVSIAALHDPSGAPVTLPSAKVKPGSASLTHVALHQGDGAYRLQLSVDSGESQVSVTLHVTPQGRPKSAKTVALSAVDPVLAPLDAPIEGVAAGRVHLTGAGFPSSGPPPAVYFALVPATNVSVAADGASLDATVPDGPPDATVSVAVVGADGQGSSRDAYFHFVPPPAITELTDPAGTPRHGGSTLGGQPRRLVGQHFRAGTTVTFDGRPATVAPITDPTRIDVVTPIGAVGFGPLSIKDDFGRIVDAPFLFEYKAPAAFSTSPFAYSPAFGAAGGGTAITITGTSFDPTDQLVIGGTNVPSTFVSVTKRTFTSPNIPEGSYTLALVDRFGTVSAGPAFEVLSAPVISTVAAVGGPHIGSGSIAVGGGTSVQVTGSNLRSTDTVTLGGTAGVVTSVTNTTLVFTSPPGTAGYATLTITDPVGQTSSLGNALRYIGYVDKTSSRQPGASSTDDLTALRGAVADLDGDGKSDDLVIVSDGSSPGTRTVRTRLFIGNSTQLVDQTSSNFPAAGSDPQGVDDYHADAVAIGDLDTSSGKDVVIAGAPVAYTTTYTYYGYYGGGYTYTTTTYTYDARVFTNNGSGTFTFSALSPPVRTAAVTCTNGGSSTFDVFTPDATASGIAGAKATALAIGDLDKDGKNDIVMSTDHYRLGTVHIAPQNVTFGAGAPGSYVDTQAASHYSYYGTTYCSPGLRIFQNRGTSGFVDVTFPRIPLAGTPGSTLPVFAGRDVKLGDIDGDTGHTLDIVVTWDDPLTVTPLGMASRGSDSARVATRILLNNGSGFFTDATAHWMPAGSAPEYWQGTRVELADLDNDGDLDLVILHAKSTNAYQGTPTYSSSALRILRNDGPVIGFTDVTASALPSVPLSGTANDNMRGTALVVRDIDGDGYKDILIGTTEALLTPSGQPARRTRLLRGGPGLVFTDDSGFLPAPTAESGEADDLVLGDIAGNQDPSLVLLTETPPAASAGGQAMRVFDWKR
jgi:hypothetical protein